MKFDWQYIIVAILLAGAIYFVLKTIRNNTKGHSCEGGDCKCSGEKAKL